MMTPFTSPIRPEDLDEVINLTVPGKKDTVSMANTQRKGIAALYNILCEGPVAYLADEVGMGKTYQALGLAALVWSEKPNARILFISPRQNLQEKWVDDYKRFFASNYRRDQKVGDDRVTSVLFRQPIHRAERFDNLRSWLSTIGSPGRIAPFLRHTSFMRPVFIGSRDVEDMESLWKRVRAMANRCGLFNLKRPRSLSPDNASWKLNLAFASALNAKLASETLPDQPYFDLVVVDEAQCLRNPDNQTNNVLYGAFEGQVSKWLFMSATPAHGGPADIPTTLNRYPAQGEIVAPHLADDLPEMQKKLQKFMVRRSRRYLTNNRQEEVEKEQYRQHDKEAWAVKDKDMKPLSTLAMALVQKGLADVLQGRNNRYRIGFLSSFESLQTSIQREDWHRDHTDRNVDDNAPDAGFIHRLATDFETKFKVPLPHVKVDATADQIAPLAFGSDDEVGGRKFLIFTRRVSTVEALRDLLALRHRQAVEARLRRCWNVPDLDWNGPSDIEETNEADDGADPEASDSESEKDLLRQATAKGGWLHRYRQTFRTSGRNTLFFEDGWLERLCRAGGVNPRKAAEQLPEELWKESWTHAHKASGGRGQYRSHRLRYLAVHGIRCCPEVFGLNEANAKPWREAYEICLRHHLEEATPDDDLHFAPELFDWPTLWTCWDREFAGTSLALPVCNPSKISDDTGRDELCRRQAARTILGQTFRLTDTLLDLYFADKAVGQASEKLAERVLQWLNSGDPGARQVLADAERWLEHLRLIVDSCLDGAGRPWDEIARENEEVWGQLFELTPVVGVTGGAGGHRRATRQFRTPSLPRVIVCTDTLKEGVDLHLFCDHVLHYGVAWTSGDMEQRVGRVDRYFSQIERRLSEEGPPPDVHLHVGYPHVVASLERGQVERVVERQREAERLMDSPLKGTQDEERELTADVQAKVRRSSQDGTEPFARLRFPDTGRRIGVSTDAAQADWNHYTNWYRQLVRRLEQRYWSIRGESDELTRNATLVLKGQARQHEIEWSFDAALGRYIITLSSPPWPSDTIFTGGKRWHTVEKERRLQSFVRLLVPTRDEGEDEAAIDSLINVLAGNAPETNTNAQELWNDSLTAISPGGVEWLSDHKASLTVRRGVRSHRVTVYAYDGSVRAVGVVAKELASLGHRSDWGNPPFREDVKEWTFHANNGLPLGYLDLHERDGLVFGIHVLHGALSISARKRLVEEVGWRADVWEASLTGTDDN
ncbi:MAG: hypothetical protein F4171_07045 [Gammaproteobacteria bacterium]|nr:hypothetical protein [Gammaproteobacteria bacterium]